MKTIEILLFVLLNNPWNILWLNLGLGAVSVALYRYLAGGPCNAFPWASQEEQETFWLVLLVGIVSWFFVLLSIGLRVVVKYKWAEHQLAGYLKTEFKKSARTSMPLPVQSLREVGGL